MDTPITHQTREAGYQAALPFIGNMQEVVYDAVHARAAGLTAEEIQEATGIGLNNARSRAN